MSPKPFLILLAAAATALWVAGPAWSDDDTYTLTINGHTFEPLEFTIPAGKKVMLTVKNLNPTPSEFESSDLNREKLVVGGGTVTLFVGPLRPGSYEFFDDFNADTPHAHITAKP